MCWKRGLRGALIMRSCRNLKLVCVINVRKTDAQWDGGTVPKIFGSHAARVADKASFWRAMLSISVATVFKLKEGLMDLPAKYF